VTTTVVLLVMEVHMLLEGGVEVAVADVDQ